MAHGGKRPNAGRKAGATSTRTKAIAEAILEDGDLTPLEFLTNVYRDVSEDMARRVDAAKAAAAYVHAKPVPSGTMSIAASITEVAHTILDTKHDNPPN